MSTPTDHPSATAPAPAQHQQQQQQQQQQPPLPPVATTLATSSPTLHLSGTPAFTATTTHTNTSARALWALVRAWAPFGRGIAIRDPARRGRRVGPTSTLVGDEWDAEALDREDSVLVRLGPGEAWASAYTVETGAKARGLRGSDVMACRAGGVYEVGLRRRRWRWMWEDEMGEGEMGEEERRRVLEGREAVEWEVGCMVEFTAVE